MGTPWLYYGLLSSSSSSAVLNSPTSIALSISSNPTLNFVLAKYLNNGTFLGFTRLSTELHLCSVDALQSLTFMNVGQSYSEDCSTNILDFIKRETQQEFYELYLLSGLSIIPIPVRMSKYRISGVLVAQQDDTQSVLTRRFFLQDVVSSTVPPSTLGSVVRVVQSIKLTMPVLTADVSTLLLPTLEINYAERQLSTLSITDASNISSPQMMFSSTYISPTANAIFLSSLGTCVLIFGIFALLVGVYNVRIWLRRNAEPSDPVTLTTMISWLLVLAHYASYIIFVLMFTICLYWFIGIKIQSGSKLLLVPVDSSTLAYFNFGLYLGFACSLAHVLHSIYRQCTVDIFFLDWEKSRGKLLSLNNEEPEKACPVSAWRSIFVANEWSRLQTFRRTNLSFNLAGMILIVIYLSLRALSVPSPLPTLTATGTTSAILLFAINSLVWTTLHMCQLIYRAVHDRFYSHRLLQFVDLLSISNISVFLLDSPFHGYYVHGRSVHPFADTDMTEIGNNMKKEENNLVSKRGLAESDDQAFEVFVNAPFRQVIDKVFALMKFGQDRGRTFARSDTHLTRGLLKGADTSFVRPAATINKLLCNFVDNGMKELKIKIRDRMGLEQYCGTNPDLSEGIVFVRGRSTPFSDLLLAGLELDFFILYIFLYNILDMYGNGPIVAVVVVGAVDLILTFVRSHFGSINTTSKTLIDPRFLL